MARPVLVLLLAMLVFLSGFVSIQSEMEVIEGGSTEESSGDCGTILTSIQMTQKQLDKLEGAVQSIIPHLRETIENRFFKLQEKIEHFIESKFDELDKKMNTKFHETKTFIDSKLTVIEDKISQYTSHVDSKLNGLEATLTHALNVSDTFNNNNACCKLCLETTAFVKNTTSKINDMNIRTLNITVTLQKMNEAIQNLTDIGVSSSHNKNIPKQNDTTVSTEPAHNASDILTTTEVNKPAPSKCDHSQQEQCCTVADLGPKNVITYTHYTELSLRGRHTVVNMTSAGLQEYNTYIAVMGEYLYLLLSTTSPYYSTDHYLYYQIGFTVQSGGHMNIYEHLPTDVTPRRVSDIYTSNIISREKYSFYYVHISGDTLEVGRRGEPPLLTHTSTELRKLRYMSFSRGAYTPGEVLYDCTAE